MASEDVTSAFSIALFPASLGSHSPPGALCPGQGCGLWNHLKPFLYLGVLKASSDQLETIWAFATQA